MKTTKKLAIILVIALLLVSMAALVACNNTPDGNGGEVKGTPGKFTVQVLLPDGKPLTADLGIQVQLCALNEEGTGELTCQLYPVGSNGVVCEAIAEIQGYAPTACNIHFPNLPENYKLSAEQEHAQVKIGEVVVIQLENA